MFDPGSTLKALHSTLDEATSAIPEGQHNAIIVDGTFNRIEGGRLRAAWLHRTESGWKVVTEGSVDKSHGVAGKIGLVNSW